MEIYTRNSENAFYKMSLIQLEKSSVTSSP